MEAAGFSSYGNSSRLGYAASELQQQGCAFVTRSHNMSTDRGLRGGPQIRKSRKMPRDFKSRGSNKIFTQELPKSIPQELSCKHLAHKASSKCMQRPVTKFSWTLKKLVPDHARWSGVHWVHHCLYDKELYNIMQGPLNGFSRMSARS